MCLEEQGQGQAIHVINISWPSNDLQPMQERSQDGMLILESRLVHGGSLLTGRGCKSRFALELLGLQATKAVDASLSLFNNFLGYWIRNACPLWNKMDGPHRRRIRHAACETKKAADQARAENERPIRLVALLGVDATPGTYSISPSGQVFKSSLRQDGPIA